MKYFMNGLIVLSFFLTLPANAQEPGGDASHTGSGYVPYVINSFNSNCFVALAGGFNMYEGEYDRRASLGQRLSPAIDVSLGKWFIPGLGLRLQYAGLTARGVTTAGAAYAKEPYGDYYKEKFNVTNLHFDVLWNLTNTFFDYKEDRLWNCIPYVGFSWARSAANRHHQNDFGITAGLFNTFYLTKRLDLTVELRQLFVNQSFDYVAGGSSKEGMTSFTVGIQVKLGKTNFDRSRR